MRSLSLGILILSLLLPLALPLAMEDDNKTEDGPGCNNVLQFRSAATRAHLILLPEALQKIATTPGLRHLVEIARVSRTKEIGGEQTHLLDFESLDATKLSCANMAIPAETLRIPQDLLSAEELETLGPEIEALHFQKVFSQSHVIPKLKTFEITKIRISGFTQLLAATEDGIPVFLEHLPHTSHKNDLHDRASTAFVLAGLKTMSDRQVLPKLLGVTEMSDGRLMAVFPIPSGFQRAAVTSLRIGIKQHFGLRAPEPTERQNARVAPFESLMDRLAATEWPLLNQSVNLESVAKLHPTAKLVQLVDHLQLPLWESIGDANAEPFFFPSYLGAGNSPWFPGALSPRYNFEITVFGERLSQIQIPLTLIEPASKWGRITLLRYEFFMSLMNGKSKVHYLDFLLEKSPSSQQEVMQVIEFFARYSKTEKLLAFLTNYKAKRYREAFQVIDGK